MRLWSIHPQYLDCKGLVALWREGLLAQKVLMGKTKGYKNHPQLNRFKAQEQPVEAIGLYLLEIYQEAKRRGYHFDKRKIVTIKFHRVYRIKVNSGQIMCEYEHLSNKLMRRDNERFLANLTIKKILPNPLFNIIKGDIEDWEKR